MLSRTLVLVVSPLLLLLSANAHPTVRRTENNKGFNCLATSRQNSQAKSTGSTVTFGEGSSGLGRREGKIEFGYGAFDGPSTWPGECQTGKNQSPIDLLAAAPNLLQPPRLDVRFQDVCTPVKFFNNGNTVEVEMPEGQKEMGFVAGNGEFFELKQFHFHTPSEHRLQEKHLPIEMHMVHQNKAGRISVLAVFFDFAGQNGEGANSFLSQLVPHLPKIKARDQETTIPGISFAPILSLIKQSSDFVYNGSLTTPPCSENVLWNVVQQPVKLTLEEYMPLVDIVGFNSRPLMRNDNVAPPPAGTQVAIPNKVEISTPISATEQPESTSAVVPSQATQTQVPAPAVLAGGIEVVPLR
ncbi:uncharacterized protein SPPG_04960 [Spizellomyces punctatus DAOM BR117]|uniref:carbonic anhydrase n=1 Tax=Spizellomyces punctatus (strain DAOM BR117) TaxID=645134 RepID=A0A0L0HEZ2_SPIPD|nr:uncharacterized protein SPPG_04960 [Spizellomyces punctatus DAOM BR117]KNC99571.1 hypothetical protein SPPG_04960 [Spizellomyces punctatus DAOM BR117]|eukprot:XP_016607611.1 hypothetical protein SPPG_04960 [Spizellomyces punctatus DAOM BR117]